MTSREPALIIISGAPATGKTTLARRLAKQCMLPLVAKDTLKEALCDSLGCYDLEDSKRLGKASIALLYHFAESLLRAGCDCLIEGYFYPALAAQDLLTLRQRCPFLPLQIHCSAPLAILSKRYQERITSGARHPGHRDEAYLPEFAPPPDLLRPIPLQGPTIELDTSNFATLNYPSLLFQVQEFLAQCEPA